MEQTVLQYASQGRGLYELTDRINQFIAEKPARLGLCHIFLHHTSASLIVTENADPTVCEDLERFLSRLVPDGDASYQHTAEGSDDMAAHVRSVLTQTELSVPFEQGRLTLGTWQGVYLWEHRLEPHRRKITVTLLGC